MSLEASESRNAIIFAGLSFVEVPADPETKVIIFALAFGDSSFAMHLTAASIDAFAVS